MNSYTKYWKGYTDFKGRSSQQDFWVPILINLAVSVGLLVAVVCSMTTVVASNSNLLSSTVFCLFVGLLVGWKLARLVPDAAVIVRRTHDVGLTGWIGVVLYIASFIPYIDLVAGVLLVIIGCLATDSANLSAFAWQSDSQASASSSDEKTTRSDAQLNAADIASDSDAKRYEQLSLDLDFDDTDQKSNDDDKSDK